MTQPMLGIELRGKTLVKDANSLNYVLYLSQARNKIQLLYPPLK